MTPSIAPLKHTEEVLEMLIHSARQKGSGLADLLEDKYEDFSDALHDVQRDVRKRARRSVKQADKLRKTGVKRARRTADHVNRRVHQDPWQVLGLIAGLAFVGGMLLGLKKPRR